MTNYEASNTLISAVKDLEGLRLSSYKCPAGIWTIGYGHTKGVRAGQKISQTQADSLLRGDLLPCVQYVNKLGVCKTQGQFDALVDFCFNLGQAQLSKSTLLAKIKAGAAREAILKEFRRWVYSGGKRLDGLVRRREWECQRWTDR